MPAGPVSASRSPRPRERLSNRMQLALYRCGIAKPISNAPGLSDGTASATSRTPSTFVIPCPRSAAALASCLVFRHKQRRHRAQTRIVDPPPAGDVAMGKIHQAELHMLGEFFVPVGAGARRRHQLLHDRLALGLVTSEACANVT